MDMLKAILDIEKKAQKIVDTFDLSALEENEKTIAFLKEFEEKEETKAKEEISAFYEKCEKELKEELKANCLLMAEKKEATEKLFYENQRRWTDEIMKKILGGDAY